MKKLALATTFAFAIAFAGSAFAGGAAPSNKADCEASGGVWDAATSTCKTQ